MDENTTEMIEKLASIIGQSGATIVQEYARWYVWTSVSWILFGAGLMFISMKWEQPESWEVSPVIVRLVLVFLGGLFIAANIGDLLAPQGIAIHRLILDIRG